MRTSIAVGQENKLLEVQHPHAAKDGGGDPSEEIADDVRSLACTHKKMRVALRPWWPSESVGIGFPGQWEDTAETAISGRQRAKSCRQDIDIGSARVQIPEAAEPGNKAEEQGDKIDDQRIKSAEHGKVRQVRKGRLRRPGPGSLRFGRSESSTSVMTLAIPDLYPWAAPPVCGPAPGGRLRAATPPRMQCPRLEVVRPARRRGRARRALRRAEKPSQKE
jgi:hypothetical protein